MGTDDARIVPSGLAGCVIYRVFVEVARPRSRPLPARDASERCCGADALRTVGAGDFAVWRLDCELA